MRTKRLIFFTLILLLVSMACLIPQPFWAGPVAGPIEKTLTPIVESGTYNFNHGELKILYDQATITTPNEGWLKPSFGCWPTSYYDDGSGYLKLVDEVLLGYCSWNSPSAINPSVTWNTKGNLQGGLEDKEIIFEFDTQADYFTHTIDIKFKGRGPFDRNHAEGIAKFVATCHSNGPETLCNHMTAAGDMVSRNSWQIKGTVPWRMDFTP